MDIRKIRKLIAIMEESDINELEVQEGEESIRLSRSATPQRNPEKRRKNPESGDDGE